MFVVRSPPGTPPKPKNGAVERRQRGGGGVRRGGGDTSFGRQPAWAGVQVADSRPAGLTTSELAGPRIPTSSRVERDSAHISRDPAVQNAPAHHQTNFGTTDVEVRFLETDVVKVILDYLQRQGFVHAMRALEKDSQLRANPANYPATFQGALRESILDGEWPSVDRMLLPITNKLDAALRSTVEFQIYRQRVVEMIAIHKGDVLPHEIGTAAVTASDQDPATLPNILEALRRVKEVCPSHDEYGELCSLLELPSLRNSECYKTWTPLEGRYNLFVRLSFLLRNQLVQAQVKVRASFTCTLSNTPHWRSVDLSSSSYLLILCVYVCVRPLVTAYRRTYRISVNARKSLRF